MWEGVTFVKCKVKNFVNVIASVVIMSLGKT